MSTAAAPGTPVPPAATPLNPFAALLSYLVPGLGQIYQGRFGKGLLFFVCLYGLFFYGMHLGSWKNVYLADVAGQFGPSRVPAVVRNCWERLQFLGQFWIGVAAWPAILQYNNKPVPFNKDFQKAPQGDEINDLQRDGDKTWDLAWVYTVIAGVLNILVIYDALAGAAFAPTAAAASVAGAPQLRKEAIA